MVGLKGWQGIIRMLVGSVWICNGLEKFGLRWPKWLHGGTGNVPDMLALMRDDTPMPLVSWIIEKLMLPLGNALNIPVGILEILLGVAILTGVLIGWAAALGALIQLFFWAGFITVDWPFQYPLLVVAHLSLAVPVWAKGSPWATKERWFQVLTACLVVMWLYEGRTLQWLPLLTGLMQGVGLLVKGSSAGTIGRVGFVVGAVLAVLAFRVESWGAFVWAYYTVIGIHLALAVYGPELANRRPIWRRVIGA